MSVVACTIGRDTITVASDSIIVFGWTKDKSTNKFAKMFQENGMIVGSVGWCSESSLLQAFCKNHQPTHNDEHGIIAFFQEFAAWKEQKCKRFDIDNSYVFVYAGKAWAVEGFFIQEITSFTAIGAGMDYALAALHLGCTAERACEVACDLSCMCERPVRVLTMARAT